MGIKCNGCDNAIYDISYMECSQKTCTKMYHPKCLGWTTETFKTYGNEEKSKWICPECKQNIPKQDNTNTPVRGTNMLNKTFTPGYVNTERGGHHNANDLSLMDNENKILEELRDFRMEMKTRLDEQTREYTLLKNRFASIETELRELKNILKVVQEKADRVDILEKKIEMLKDQKEKWDPNTNATIIPNQSSAPLLTSENHASSYARITRLNQNKPVVVKDNQQSVATKLSVEGDKLNMKIVNSSILPITSTQQINNLEVQKKEEMWTTVNKRKRYPNSQVKKGESTNSIVIQGTERKKYLHVWRLEKNTTVENLEKHVSSIFGKDVPIKIDKIKHKTERDYASFIIGVPESKFDVLCRSENWAINIEYCEWVWFRRPATNSNPREKIN